jgi:hypothetical protein
VSARDELVAAEEALWRAAGDRSAYEPGVAADVLHVFPGLGIVEREPVLGAVARAEPWQDFTLDDLRVVELGQGVAALVYTAEASRASGQTYRAAMTSVYRREGCVWKLVLHQQTPLEATGGT